MNDIESFRPSEPIRLAPEATSPGDHEIFVQPGILDSLPELLRRSAEARRYAIIADTTVASLLGEALLDVLRRAGLAVELLRFPAGEASKDRRNWAALTDRLLELRFGRDSCIIALGGGVTSDLAGFVAATFMRGIPLVLVPTTLLAMLDAAVGGKTGLDTPAGKNLVGAFHQPRLVLMDTGVLRTLPDPEFRAGLAEAVKHGAIADADYLGRIEAEAKLIFSRDAATLSWLVSRSVQIKVDIVAGDPLEAGRRATLNFGHTIGHALEATSAFRLGHGFAVAMGMRVEAVAGERAGITQQGTAVTLRRSLVRLGLPPDPPPDVDPDTIIHAAYHDKKARSTRPRFVLLERIGACARGPDDDWTFPLPDQLIRDVLAAPLD